MAELSEVDVLVTDDALPADARRLLESQVRELVIAPRSEPRGELARRGSRPARAADGTATLAGPARARMGDIGRVCTNPRGSLRGPV